MELQTDYLIFDDAAASSSRRLRLNVKGTLAIILLLKQDF